MQVYEHFSLKQYNTFGIDAYADKFIEITSNEDILQLINSDFFQTCNYFILGGGSNVLFTNDFNGSVIKLSNKGIEVIDEDSNYVYIEAQAGEDWDEFVNYCTMNNWAGLENLSLIPGQVGASPIQNIGAYGTELKDVFHSLSAYDIFTKEKRSFSLNECDFGYRSSIFKNKWKKRFIISSVTFRLSKNIFNINKKYGSIESEISNRCIEKPTIKDIREIICQIRAAKLPDINTTGSAGSFFKNPVVSLEKYNLLKQKHPELVAYKESDNQYKIAAGWLIDKAGWKGYKEGDAGVYPKQALVLVNYGNAGGIDILHLSKKIEKSIFKEFEIKLETEVNII